MCDHSRAEFQLQAPVSAAASDIIADSGSSPSPLRHSHSAPVPQAGQECSIALISGASQVALPPPHNVTSAGYDYVVCRDSHTTSSYSNGSNSNMYSSSVCNNSTTSYGSDSYTSSSSNYTGSNSSDSNDSSASGGILTVKALTNPQSPFNKAINSQCINSNCDISSPGISPSNRNNFLTCHTDDLTPPIPNETLASVSKTHRFTRVKVSPKCHQNKSAASVKSSTEVFPYSRRFSCTFPTQGLLKLSSSCSTGDLGSSALMISSCGNNASSSYLNVHTESASCISCSSAAILPESQRVIFSSNSPLPCVHRVGSSHICVVDNQSCLQHLLDQCPCDESLAM